MSHHCRQNSLPGKTVVRLAFSVLVAASAPLTASAQSAPAVKHQVALGAPTSSPPATTLTLTDCLQLAAQRQPRIAAQRASLAAAEDGYRALEALRCLSFLDPELPIRQHQACLGVSAAAAAVDQAEREAAYAVTRTYFTVLYSQEQARLTRSVMDRLSATHDTAKRSLDAGARDVTAGDVKRAFTYLRLAETKHIQAVQGAKRALAALREAIGIVPDFAIDVPASRLLEPKVKIVRDDIVAWALARRSEIARAVIFADVTCLEADAQGTCVVIRKETFAAGTDLHALQVPQGIHNGEYRPGAIPPEMPTLLVGTRANRVKHARDLHARALSVVDATRNLIGLEAENAYLLWEEAALQVQATKEAADAADSTADDLAKDFTSGQKVRVEDVISSRVLAAQARGQYYDFLFKEIIALADLERVTAGGLTVNLVELTVPPQAKGK